MLITGAVMLVTGVVISVTCCYKRKNGGEVPGSLSERVGDEAVEMCGLSESISWISHLIHSGQAP